MSSQSDSNNIEFIKSEIQARYNRLKSNRRRPSLEYVSPDELRNIFKKYVIDFEKFNTLSDLEILQLFDDFFDHATIVNESDKGDKKDKKDKEDKRDLEIKDILF